MVRLCCCCCCSPICCVSRKKRQSFPIHGKQNEKKEINQISIQHVEAIRITPSPVQDRKQDKPKGNNKIESKSTIKKKTKRSKKNTKKDDDSSSSEKPPKRLFDKSKKHKTPSPIPMSVHDLSDKKHNKSFIDSFSSWSLSTSSESSKTKKPSKHQSCGDSYDLTKANSSKKISTIDKKKKPADIKTPVKSKLVLENVRKLIKDQNVQQQHSREPEQSNKNRRKKSAQL